MRTLTHRRFFNTYRYLGAGPRVVTGSLMLPSETIGAVCTLSGQKLAGEATPQRVRGLGVTIHVWPTAMPLLFSEPRSNRPAPAVADAASRNIVIVLRAARIESASRSIEQIITQGYGVVAQRHSTFEAESGSDAISDSRVIR